MLKSRKICVLVSGIVLSVMLTFTISISAANDAAPLLNKVDKAEGYKTNYSEVKQEITTTSGDKRTLVIRTWAVKQRAKTARRIHVSYGCKGTKNTDGRLW